MKQKIIYFILGILTSLTVMWLVSALEIQTDLKNALIYIQKIFVTSDWTSNGEKRVVIDGSDGSISMSWSLNVKGDVILKEKVIDGYEIADNAVNDRVLADDAVDTAAIQDGSITNEKISNSAITSDKILDETITENDLSENSVWASELKESDYYEMKGLFLSDGDLVLQNPSDWWKTEIRSAWPIYIHPDDDKTGDDNFYITNSEWNPWIVFSQSEKVGIWKTNPEAKVDINGNTIIRWNLDMKNNSIINLADPVNDTDAVNKRYVDDKIIGRNNLDIAVKKAILGDYSMLPEYEEELRCSSINFSRVTCDIDPGSLKIKEVILLRQISSSSCIFNESYGIEDENTIWVNNGCRWEFNIKYIK